MKGGLEKLTKEERSANGKKGGIKSGEVRRNRKLMKETLNYLMQVPLNRGKSIDLEKIKNLSNVNDLNLTTEQAILLAQIHKAMKGDTNAFLAIRDTLGEKPENNINFDGVIPIVISGSDELE